MSVNVLRSYTHHDNASRLLHCAHAHNGGHANGGALEVNPTAWDIGQNSGGAQIKMLKKNTPTRCKPIIAACFAKNEQSLDKRCPKWGPWAKVGLQ